MFGTCIKNSLCPESHFNEITELIKEVKDLEGSFVECGVWKGGMCMWMVHCQKEYKNERDIYLYDTFDGMTNPNSEKDGTEPKKIYKDIENGKYKRKYDRWHNENKWAYAPLEMVKKNMKIVGYNEDKIHYVIGDVAETLNKVVPDKIVILRLDTDFYESTKKELEVLFPKLVKGGYLIIDDYNNKIGSTTATDEFLKDNKEIEIYSKKSRMIIQKI